MIVSIVIKITDQFVTLNLEHCAHLIKLLESTFLQEITVLQSIIPTALQIQEVFAKNRYKMVHACLVFQQINALLKMDKPVSIISKVSASLLTAKTAQNKHIQYNKDHTAGRMMDHNAP